MFPVRVMKELGVETLIISNSCGCCNLAFEPSTFMAIADHVNLIGNPLIGNKNNNPKKSEEKKIEKKNITYKIR